jgi:hypothetical protein
MMICYVSSIVEIYVNNDVSYTSAVYDTMKRYILDVLTVSIVAKCVIVSIHSTITSD